MLPRSWNYPQRTALHLHLSHTDGTKNVLRLSLCRCGIESCCLYVRAFSVTNPPGSQPTLCQDRQSISELDGSFSKFECLMYVSVSDGSSSSASDLTLLKFPLRRNISQRALATAALFWLALKALSTSFVPAMNAWVRSASGSCAFLLALIASRPRSSWAAHSEGFYLFR